ncbi:MAG: helix-turn-helix domain-containing protein [Arsenophonus sp. NEOnobi-MAG3]
MCFNRPCKKYERIIAEAIAVTPEDICLSRYPDLPEIA